MQIKAFIVCNQSLVIAVSSIVVTLLNTIVLLTFKSLGFVNFNFLIYKLLFEGFSMDYLHIKNTIAVFAVFCVLNLGLVYLVASLLKTGFHIIGWVVFGLFVLSLIPVFDVTKINI